MNSSISKRLKFLLIQRWDSWVMVFIMAFLVMLNLVGGRPSPDERKMLLLGIMAVLFGIFLVETRWPGKWIAIYSFLMSLIFSLLIMSGILINASRPFRFMDWSLASSSTLQILVERLVGWGRSLFTGNIIEDPLPGILLGSILIMNMFVWMIWWIERKHEGFIAIIPCGFILGWNILQQGQKAPVFIAFLFLAIMIIAITTYRQQTSRWDDQNIDWPYPGSFLPEWMMSAGIFAFALCAIAYLGITFATPEGIKETRRIIEERRTSSLSSEGSQSTGQVDGSSSTPGFSDNQLYPPPLDRIGLPPSASKATLFWVSVNSKDPVIASQLLNLNYRWRMQIFDDYDGRGWREIPLLDTNLDTPGEINQPSPGRALLQQDFRIAARSEQMLPSANQPVLTENAVIQGISSDSNLVTGSQDSYTVFSWMTVPGRMQLDETSTGSPQEIKSQFLKLPPSLPTRVIELAGKVTSGAVTNYEKAILIQKYLRENYTYSLSVSEPPEGRDVVDHFLFNSRQGFCSYFASAMVVLLRSSGVPSRVVSGYARGEFDAEINAFRVTPSDAHAWVEIYFPEYGWVEFEPTPAYDALEYGAPISTKTTEWLPISRFAIRIYPALRRILFAIAIIGVLFLVYWIIRNFHPVKPPSDAIQYLYWSLLRKLKSSGIAIHSSNTPHETLIKALEVYKGNARFTEALPYITQLHEKAFYGQSDPSRDEFNRALALWRGIRFPLTWLGFKESLKKRRSPGKS